MIDNRPFAHDFYHDRFKHALVRGKSHRGASRLVQLLMAVAVSIYLADFLIAAPQPQGTDGRAVAKVVDEFFASQADYQNGDVITRSQVEKVVAKLESDGMKLSNPKSVVNLALADDSFLVRELSTPNGKKFMRTIAPRPGAYSHLDRLSTIPRGQSLIRDLIRQKDGDKMIQYLATTKGGKNMGSMLAQARGGVDLNKPTGRIYTADDLVSALKIAMAKP